MLEHQPAEAGGRSRRPADAAPDEPDTRWDERIVTVIEGCVATLQREAELDRQVVPADLAVAAERVRRHLVGWDVLQPLVDHPFIEDIWVNSPERILFKLGGQVHRFQDHFQSDDEVQELVKRHIRPLGLHRHRLALRRGAAARTACGCTPSSRRPRRATRASACASTPSSIARWTSSSRGGCCRRPLARFLEALVAALRADPGQWPAWCWKDHPAPGAGARYPALARVVVLEDTPELDLPDYLPNAVDLQTRRPNVEGQGAIDLQVPCREHAAYGGYAPIVGEVRGPEAWQLLDAIHNGMGGMFTIHGWSAEDALERLADRALEAGKQTDYGDVLHRISTNVRIVVQVREEQSLGGLRRVVQVYEITGLTDDRTRLRGHNLWMLDPETDELVPTTTPSGRVLELLRSGACAVHAAHAA